MSNLSQDVSWQFSVGGQTFNEFGVSIDVDTATNLAYVYGGAVSEQAAVVIASLNDASANSGRLTFNGTTSYVYTSVQLPSKLRMAFTWSPTVNIILDAS